MLTSSFTRREFTKNAGLVHFIDNNRPLDATSVDIVEQGAGLARLGVSLLFEQLLQELTDVSLTGPVHTKTSYTL